VESASPSAEATFGKAVGLRCADVVDARGLDGTTICTQTCAAACTDGTPAVEVRSAGRTWRMYCAGAGAHRTVTMAPTGEDIDGLMPLSPREKEVLILVAAGLTNARIARRLGLSCATVRTHIEHILSKLRVRSRSAAVARAVVTGMLEG
jgi:DNA-binding CsgD family transcriptional regulator